MHVQVSKTEEAVTDRPSSVGRITDDLTPRTEVAKGLSVCEHTLRNWERGGRGPPPIRIGRRVFYRAEAVREWLLQQERAMAPK
jgi:predicted DNA-binding transcriptional regulator AlpA